MDDEQQIFLLSQPYTPLPLFLPDNAMRAGVSCLMPSKLLFQGARWHELAGETQTAVIETFFAWACEEGIRTFLMGNGVFSKFSTIEGVRLGLETGSEEVDAIAAEGVPPFVWPILNGLQVAGGLQAIDPDLNLAMGLARNEHFAGNVVRLTLELVGYDEAGSVGLTSGLSDEALAAFLDGETPTP